MGTCILEDENSKEEAEVIGMKEHEYVEKDEFVCSKSKKGKCICL